MKLLISIVRKMNVMGKKKTKLDKIITTNLKETFECPKSQNEIHENKK